METCKPKEGVGQIAVQVLGGVEYGAVGFDPEVDLEQAEVQYSAVIDECDQSDDGDDEHQHLQREMHNPREPTPERAGVCHRCRGRMPASPPKTGDEHRPEEQTQQRMNVDPEALCPLR